MALTYDELDSHVQSVLLKNLIDQVFVGDPALTRLTAKSKVMLKGGRRIDQPVIYGALSGGSYSGMDPFDIAYKETDTMATFDWKWVYVNVTIPGTHLDLVEGARDAISLLTSKMQNAEMTMSHLLSTMFFSDGTGNGGKDLDGFLNGCDDGTNYSSYGGISRSTNSWWKGNLDSDGGIVTPARVSTWISDATKKNKKPDLIFTTKALYNRLWALVQPQQRFLSERNADLASVGFSGIEIDGVPIIVDEHCPSGTMIGINTDFWKFYINKNKNFKWTPPKEPLKQDAYVRQLLLGANLFTVSPRMSFIATGLS
jgi:hypothetical protein